MRTRSAIILAQTALIRSVCGVDDIDPRVDAESLVDASRARHLVLQSSASAASKRRTKLNSRR